MGVLSLLMSSGVAISASLLPPAVNTGLYWAMALMSAAFNDSFHQDFKNETLLAETKVWSILFDKNVINNIKS